MADTTNNNGKPPARQEVQKPLGEARRAHIEAGLRAFQETSQEADELKSEIDRHRQDLMARDLEIKSLNERMDQQSDAYAGQIAALESRAHENQIARDQAVSEAVALKTILAGMKKLWDLARVDDAPATGEDH